jgi:hypothetical protein
MVYQFEYCVLQRHEIGEMAVAQHAFLLMPETEV